MAFGERLKKLRKEYNLKQQEVADRINVNRTTYANYENGDRFPSIEVLIQIADLFKVSLDFLVRGKYTTMFSEDAEVKVNAVPVITSVLKGNFSIRENCEYFLPTILSTDEADKYFYFKVNDESMCNCNILMDSLILFYEQSEIEDNSLRLFQVEDKYMVLGHVQLIGRTVIIKPINPTYEVLMLDINDITNKKLLVLGKATKITQNVADNVFKNISIDTDSKDIDSSTKGVIDEWGDNDATIDEIRNY